MDDARIRLQLKTNLVPDYAERLWVAWRDNIEKLEEDNAALVRITDEMQLLRLTVLDVLEHLN